LGSAFAAFFLDSLLSWEEKKLNDNAFIFFDGIIGNKQCKAILYFLFSPTSLSGPAVLYVYNATNQITSELLVDRFSNRHVPGINIKPASIQMVSKLEIKRILL
jgi:hypothetical protein